MVNKKKEAMDQLVFPANVPVHCDERKKSYQMFMESEREMLDNYSILKYKILATRKASTEYPQSRDETKSDIDLIMSNIPYFVPYFFSNPKAG